MQTRRIAQIAEDGILGEEPSEFRVIEAGF